jgi:hypothetical protein
MKAYHFITPAKLTTALTAAMALASSHQSRASITYSTAGSTYSQNFDSLPNTPQNVSLGASPIGWIDDTTAPGANQFSILGWYLYHPLVQAEGGANGHQRLRIGAGTANTGAFMSWGASASTDRALGDLGSNTLNPVSGPGGDIYIGLRLSNNTGQILDSFTLSYNGEQWRDGGATTPTAQTMSFTWSTTATAISDPNTSFTPASALSFTSPVFANTGSGAAVDGNGAGKVAIGPVTVSGINWLPGTDLWLRWDDLNDVGNDHGLGIDDLSFSADIAVPEPSSLALLGLGIAGVMMVRRRKK